jgi:hypothetical protein
MSVARRQWSEFQTASGFPEPLYLCRPEPLRGASLEELSLDELPFEEDSLGAPSLDELSFDPPSDFAFSSFLSFESPPPDAPADDGFLA